MKYCSFAENGEIHCFWLFLIEKSENLSPTLQTPPHFPPKGGMKKSWRRMLRTTGAGGKLATWFLPERLVELSQSTHLPSRWKLRSNKNEFCIKMMKSPKRFEILVIFNFSNSNIDRIQIWDSKSNAHIKNNEDDYSSTQEFGPSTKKKD